MSFSFLSSYLLVLVALLYAKWYKIGLEKSIFTSSLRAFLQLLLLGFALSYIFEITNIWLEILILLFMVAFASYTASKRTDIQNGFYICYVSIGASSFLVLFSLVGLRIISLEPREFITIGGMIIGNAMNIASLAIINFRDNALLRIAEIEGYTALGADLFNALKSSIRVSVKLALTPVINNLQTVGIVLIPGIMSGMILAGASPLKAVSYQLVIMYMILAVSLLASVFAIRLSYSKILEKPLNN